MMIGKIIAFPFMCIFSIMCLLLFAIAIPFIFILGVPIWFILDLWTGNNDTPDVLKGVLSCPFEILSMMWE